MPRFSSARRSGRFAARVASLGLAAAVVVGCSTSAAAPSFDASAPCTADTRVADAYPDLEARIPATIGGTARISLDSGRNCSTANLGTLAGHGLREVQFAGGVWQDSPQSALTLAVFSAPGLRAEWIGEWYEATARSARVTGSIQATRPTINGRQAYRMDLVNGESPQTAISWQGTSPDTVLVVLASDEPESRIAEAIAALSAG